MDKRPYVRPVLKTQVIALGVFGQYGSNDRDDINPSPIKIIPTGRVMG
ncbi:MAG: hypothetical protein R6X25_06405 [Candidatus Krumholzibacteriia bacterium]